MTVSTVTRKFFNATTARTTSYLDMFKTIATLLVLGAILAAIPLAIGAVSASVATTVSLFAASLTLIVGAALFNYCFAAQFTQVALSARPIEDHKKYGLLKINLRDMAGTLIDHANKKPGAKQLPKDILIANFRDEHNIRMSSVYGFSVNASAIFIPSEILMAHIKKLTKQEIASLLMLEVIKIRNAHGRRGPLHIISNIGFAFATFLNDLDRSLDRSPFFLARLLGVVVGPLKFIFLFQASRNRTYQYEAMEQLIKECGTDYGRNLKSAYAKLALPWENSEDDLSLASPRVDTPTAQKAKKGSFYKSCATLVLLVAKSLKEVFSDNPAANKTNDFLANKIAQYPCIETPEELVMPNTLPEKPKATCATCSPVISLIAHPIAAANEHRAAVTLENVRKRLAK